MQFKMLLAVVLLVLGMASIAEARPRPVLTGHEAREHIRDRDPRGHILECHRSTPTAIQCRVLTIFGWEIAPGERPAPIWAKLWAGAFRRGGIAWRISRSELLSPNLAGSYEVRN